MATVAMKVASAIRKRGVLVAGISVVSALLAAKGHGPIALGFWDGPS